MQNNSSIRKKPGRGYFTFVEILVAVAIMGVSLIMVLAIVGTARSRLLKAQQLWGREHLLYQATEFYLLAGHQAVVPDGLLPAGFSSSCILESIDDLPLDTPTEIQGWQLGRLRVQVWNAAGELLGVRVVEKMVPTTDFF